MLLYRTEKKPFLAAAAHFVTHGPHLRTISVFTDFFFSRWTLSLSISFIPGSRCSMWSRPASMPWKASTFFFGGPSKAAEDLQTYKNDMSALRGRKVSRADFS